MRGPRPAGSQAPKGGGPRGPASCPHPACRPCPPTRQPTAVLLPLPCSAPQFMILPATGVALQGHPSVDSLIMCIQCNALGCRIPPGGHGSRHTCRCRRCSLARIHTCMHAQPARLMPNQQCQLLVRAPPVCLRPAWEHRPNDFNLCATYAQVVRSSVLHGSGMRSSLNFFLHMLCCHARHAQMPAKRCQFDASAQACKESIPWH